MHPILKIIVQSHIDRKVYELYDKFDEETLLAFHERLIANRKEYEHLFKKFENQEYSDMMVAYMELGTLLDEYKDKFSVVTGYLNSPEIREYIDYLNTM
jgi:Zn-dependent oligopeptidase